MGPPINLNQSTIRKDTVLLPALGYVIIHFISNNPGWWFLHCHMEPHQLEGMALVINEAQEKQPPPPEGMQTCGNFTWTVDEFLKAVQNNPGDEPEFPTWLIIVIVIACVIVVAVIVFIIILIIVCIFKKKKRLPSPPPTPSPPGIEIRETHYSSPSCLDMDSTGIYYVVY